MSSKPLSDKHARFLSEYRARRNAGEAYTAVYGTEAKSASRLGHRLLKKVHIAAELQRLDTEQAQDLGIESDRLLLEAWHIATADARELVEWRVGCCRYCYGEQHRYQRTVAEYNTAFANWTEARAAKKRGTPAEFDHQGGIGWDPRKEPIDECPECVGDGQGRVLLKPTSEYSVAAAALYAGVKETQHGIEVKMHSKLDALEKLFKHFGMYAEDNKQKQTPLGEALAGFMSQLHADEAGKLKHSGGRPRLVAKDGKAAA